MLRTRIALAIALAAAAGGPSAERAGLVPTVTAAVLSAQALYADALAKDQAVRVAIDKGMASEALGKAVRTVFAAYDGLVRQYPTSGYSDDALWRAAQLATDVAALVKDAAYQATAARYVKRLASEYPSSKHARQVPEVSPSVTAVNTTGRLAAASSAGTPAPPVTTPPAAPPPAGAAPVAAPPSAALPAVASATPAMALPSTAPGASGAPGAPTLPTGPPSGRGRLLAVHRTVLPDVVRITLDIDQEVTFRQERLSGPDRIFFDFARTATARSLAERTVRFDQDTDVVRQVRIGQQSADTTRVVLDTAGVASCSATPLYAPYRLVIDCVRSSPPPAGTHGPARGSTAKTDGPKAEAAAVDSRPKPLTPATLARRSPAAPASPLVAPAAAAVPMPAPVQAGAPPVLSARRIPVGLQPLVPGAARLSSVALAALTAETTAPLDSERAVASAAKDGGAPPLPITNAAATVAAAAVSPARPSGPAAAPAPAPIAPAAPARNLDGGLSIARQLGLSVSRIVIDPGHGGHDPGARGAGTTEAAVVLDIALRLEKLLLQEDGVEVILTRRSDDFVPLEERTAIANREGADLFLSIHANASSVAAAAGVETYFLNFARDRVAAAVAARENAASGKPMSALPDVVKTIALSGKVDESRDLATLVQRALVQKLKPAHQSLRDLGVKQAPFVVLIGAAMPSVLAEVSFMTNEQEARLLKAPNYRQRIAEALFAAVQRYQSSLTRINATGQ